MKKKAFSLLIILMIAQIGQASHIAGAELTYKCINWKANAADYEITLKLYRDCINANPQAVFPDPLTFFIYESTSKTMWGVIDVAAPFQTPQIVPQNWSACVGSPYNLCIEEGVYVRKVTLPHIQGGFDIAYSLCCRNNVITNLANPGAEGVTFLGHFPGSSEINACNSMPVFKQAPSLFLCAGQTYNFDHSAFDPDGDSLVYQLSNPYSGLNANGVGASTTNPVPSLAAPAGAPPYQNVVYSPGFDWATPFGIGTISIDPKTGYLTAVPLNIGIYVVAISVLEYRDGVLLSENKRDFQFHVINCLPPVTPPIISPDLSTVPNSGDTIYAIAANNFCFNFTVSDNPSVTNLVVEPVSNIFGGNGGFPSPYASLSLSGNNPVNGTVCWTPACEAVGQVYELIISAYDSSACPNYGIVLDTIWISVQPTVGSAPQIEHDLGNLPQNGDTLLMEVQTPFCYSFFVTDSSGLGGNYSYSHAVLSPNGDSLNNTHTINTNLVNDTLFGDLCWQSFCNIGTVYMMTINGIDKTQCPPDDLSSDTVFIRILPPPTAFPMIDYDLGNLNLIGDTIQAFAFDEFCFAFNVLDTSGLSDSMRIRAEVEPVGGGNTNNGPVQSGYISGDTLIGEVCWEPKCEHLGQVYRLIVTGIQVHKCFVFREVSETLYVKVNLLNNPAPSLLHDLGPGEPLASELTLQDDQQFCMDFILEDPIKPGFLQLETEVVFLNGQPYPGQLPEVNFTTELDSLIEGTLCWEIECEYSNQSFIIYLIGRDTFDCGGNIVLDSIFVNHEDKIPSEVTQCRVSVLPGDRAIALDWESNPETDVLGYLVFKSENESGPFVFVDSVPGLNVSSYLDSANADAQAWCYQVFAYDRCGNHSEWSEPFCSVHLSGQDATYDSQLFWSAFVGWSNGVGEYEVHFSELPNLTAYERLGTTAPGSLSYLHIEPEAAINCYRVKALEGNPDCGVESWSNEVCITFPPRLYFPNAFTPNADGKNDVFTLPGLFVESFHLQVFDRWGKLIFATSNVEEGWDGSFKNGEKVPEGVYVFVLDAKGYEGTLLHRSGSITLLR